MSNPLDQLNLTTQERRAVLIIGLVVIFVLNYLFVWPHFGEWGKTKKQLDTMYSQMSNWNAEILRDVDVTNGYKKQLAKLERQQGGSAQMDQQVQLQQSVMAQANQTGVDVNNYTPTSSRGASNEFFEEQSIEITVESQEPQLIDFLYNVGNDPAMIRVSELTLRPADQNRYRLRGSVTLTATYSKRPAGPPLAQTKAVPGVKKVPPGKPVVPPGPGQKNLPGGPGARPLNPQMMPGHQRGQNNL